MLVSDTIAVKAILLISLALVAAVGVVQPVAAQDSQPPQQPGTEGPKGLSRLRLLRSDVDGIVVELTAPPLRFERIARDGQIYDRLVLSGYAHTAKPGQPELPLQTVVLGVPYNARIDLTFVTDSVSELSGRYRISPAPEPAVVPVSRPDDPLQDLHRVSVESGAAAPSHSRHAQSDGQSFYPSAPVQILSSGSIRDQRYVQLGFYPLQYLPATGQLRLHQHLVVQLRFEYDGAAPGIDPLPNPEAPFEAILRQTLLNYDTARHWRRRPPAAVLSLDLAPNPPASAGGWKIVTGEAGLYRVTYGELQAAGVPVARLDPRTLRLYHDGLEVPIRVLGESDGRFDSGDLVLFYGADHRTRYTDSNVYWLTHGGTGRRMATRSVAPAAGVPVATTVRSTRRLENDRYYLAGYPRTGEADRWYWEVLNPPNYATATFTATLSGVATSEAGCRLRSALFGLTSNASVMPDHHVSISLNGTVVDEARWDGQTERLGDASVPCSLLAAGANTLHLHSPHDTGASSDVALVNWFEIEYLRQFLADENRLAFRYDLPGEWEFRIDGFSGSDLEAYDVTDPEAPVLLTSPLVEAGAAFRLRVRETVAAPKTYLVQRTTQRLAPLAVLPDTPSNWRSSTHGADYIVITHDDFRAAVQPLVEHRSAQGLRTAVVDVQDIYDEFSAGHFDARAIRDFLEYAYLSWQAPAPSYVLLVGDGHYDFKNARGTGEPVFIPPYLWAVDPFLGETASDNRYVTVAGDDLVPDLAIGRLPVQTAAQAAAVVNKILSYESAPRTDAWNKRLLFVADNAYSSAGSPDPAGNFWAISDDLVVAHVPAPFVAERIYYDPSPRYAGEAYKYTTPAAMRTALVNAINAGALVVNYVGHAAPQFWAGEKLSRFEDVDALTNTRFPVMLPMTCYEGSFHIPNLPSLAEYLLLQDGRGAIASFSPDGLGVATGHDYLDKGFLDALFQEGIHEVGPAVVRARLNLYANSGGAYLDLMDTFNLLGDPALRIAVPGVPYDFNENGAVDAGDVQMIAGRWRQSAGPPYDLDGDGRVTVMDIMRVIARFGERSS